MKKPFSILFILLFVFGCNKKPTETNSLDTTAIKDSLPSWNNGKSKQAILDFVTKTTTHGSPDFIPEADRIAVFDNDGTLWSEQPMYFQLAYAIDFIKKEAPNHPEWAGKEPYKSLLAGDLAGVMKGGEKALIQLVMASHAGMDSEAFTKSVEDWLATSVHPKTGKPYNQMIFQPMVELLDLLRGKGYKTFIVSGGGIDFMRVWAEKAYGIPPYQVIGSSIKAKYEVVEGNPTISKLAELNFIDDGAGKPVGIFQHIGKRPVFAAGNSDGDYQMLEYTTTGAGPRFGLIVHHTDSVREYAYDRGSPIGKLEKGLDDAQKFNWLIVDMKTDWNNIYPD
ncbi:HAD family phosphatase [Algoriphagus sp. A40]|uniref:HAD family hydrolase n=1 Tax=Algoriphagus sp. A40 TaxID=1945863 RepID=UPI0009843716|nr:HAD family hydrolase [Algoriphagus sp. A40]OOG77824.1 haloacid dehalogenase [Algoriphagus sp. A40]